MKERVYMKNTIRFLVAREKGGEQVFKALFFHPMEPGNRRDWRSGQTFPADYIDEVLISVDGEPCFACSMGVGISKDPFLSFVFARPLVDGQVVKISWVDNRGQETSYETTVTFNEAGRFLFAGNDKGTEVQRLVPQAGPVCKTQQSGAAQ